VLNGNNFVKNDILYFLQSARPAREINNSTFWVEKKFNHFR